MNELLTDAEVTVLNAARLILQGLEKRSDQNLDDELVHTIAGRGRFAEACERANAGIFNVLNVANAYCNVSLTHEQMHMRPDPRSV